MSREPGLRLWARLGNIPFLGMIYLYRVTLSPIMGGQCRYEPSCSRYGIRAYQLHGPIKGSVLTIRRILRCHPLAKGGYDPVPIAEDCSGVSVDSVVDDAGKREGRE